jgi:integrase
LLTIAKERIEDAMEDPGKHRYARMDILDFIKLQAATCMRASELRSVRVRDVTIQKSEKLTIGGKPVDPVMLNLMKQSKNTVTFDPNEYLEIDLKKGKRGPRTVVTRAAMSGVETFRSLVKRKGLKPGDLLFEPIDKRERKDPNKDPDNSEAFTELLLAADLRVNELGIQRNLAARGS